MKTNTDISLRREAEFIARTKMSASGPGNLSLFSEFTVSAFPTVTAVLTIFVLTFQ